MKSKLTNLMEYQIAKQRYKQHLKNFFGSVVFLFTFLSGVYAQNIGINTTGANPNSKALLDIDANNVTGEKKGLLIPRMTTTERNTLSGTGTIPESLLIYNTTTKCFEAWNQSALSWVAFGCLNCQLPGAFAANTASSVAANSFTANWSASGLATGYYLDVSTSSTFASFVTGFNNLSVSNVVTYSVTGLTASTTYYYRVRAVNACGTTTNSNTITQATTAEASWPANYTHCGGTPTTIVDVTSTTGRVWMDRNLGASRAATSSTDVEAYGSLFQYGRFADGHQCVNRFTGDGVTTSGTTTTLSTSDTPGHGWFIAVNTGSIEWRNPPNYDLWQNGTNNPCPVGYRLPTDTEWFAEYSSWSLQNANGAFASPLKLTVAGYRQNNMINMASNGLVVYTGTVGYYFHGNRQVYYYPNDFEFWSSGVVTSNPRAANEGASVRCIKN